MRLFGKRLNFLPLVEVEFFAVFGKRERRYEEEGIRIEHIII